MGSPSGEAESEAPGGHHHPSATDTNPTEPSPSSHTQRCRGLLGRWWTAVFQRSRHSCFASLVGLLRSVPMTRSIHMLSMP